jgi:hypothetical protein
MAALSVVAAAADASRFPHPERLTYQVEWRSVTAGNATLQLARQAENWQMNLTVESVGFVSRLFRVLDTYKITSNDKFCGERLDFDAQEGKRHSMTTVEFDSQRHKLLFNEKDLVKNLVDKHEMEMPPCTHEITGALAAVREMRLEPGKTITLPVTNGKKLANIKVEAQGREKIAINGKSLDAVRYEAFVFDNVLYRRKGRLFVWMTDDPERLPIQFRFQMGFPIGNITLELQKQEKL